MNERKNIIQRRKFIAGAAVGTVAAATSSFPSPAISKGLKEWKMVMTWPKVLPGLGTGALRLADRITKLSYGKLTIKAYGGGEIVPAMGIFDAVSQGTVEMGHCASYYWLNKHRSAAFFCCVPGGLTAQEQNAWLYFGGGQQLWDQLYAEFNLKPFPAGNTGSQMGGWFNKEINHPKDLKGLKMRIPGLAGEVLNRLGGSSQTIPPQELFTAIQTGIIDALEWVGPWNDMALGFHRVAKYYYGPGFHEGGPTLELMINKKSYDSLPKDLQRVIKVSCATENNLMEAEFYLNNVRSFQLLKDKHNVDIRDYAKPVLKAFYKIAEEVVAETANEGKLSKSIYESYAKFRKNSMDMGYVSERGFMNGRML